MKPEADQILGISAAQLMQELAPLLPAGYARSAASLLSVMMVLSAQEYERGAEIRAAENAELLALFGELAPLVSDAALKAELTRAAAAAEGSLAISALNEANGALRRQLIALHIHVEAREGADARACETRIWKTLKASADRRLARLA